MSKKNISTVCVCVTLILTSTTQFSKNKLETWWRALLYTIFSILCIYIWHRDLVVLSVFLFYLKKKKNMCYTFILNFLSPFQFLLFLFWKLHKISLPSKYYVSAFPERQIFSFFLFYFISQKTKQIWHDCRRNKCYTGPKWLLCIHDRY